MSLYFFDLLLTSVSFLDQAYVLLFKTTIWSPEILQITLHVIHLWGDIGLFFIQSLNFGLKSNKLLFVAFYGRISCLLLDYLFIETLP